MEALIRATYTDVHRLCMRLLRDPADAADATQEVFLRVTRSVLGFRGEAAFGTWLHRVTVNVCATMLRRRGDARARGQSAGHEPFAIPGARTEASDDTDVEATVLGTTEAGAVLAALRALPDGDRAIITLRDLDGLTTREAAAVLGVSESVAKVRLHRAHARLRKAIAG